MRQKAHRLTNMVQNPLFFSYCNHPRVISPLHRREESVAKLFGLENTGTEIGFLETRRKLSFWDDMQKSECQIMANFSGRLF
jgi:hypothetical protein